MAASQCLDDFPFSHPWFATKNELGWQEFYKEKHRLALEELVDKGEGAFFDFLKQEKVANFLSDEEIQTILKQAVNPLLSEDGFDQSLNASLDCSSVTYFPEQSDVEPPALEIGWPAFATTRCYRGVTKAEVHFQPSFGESIYSCKEAVRKLIKGAKEVIAVVMDSFTDIDIFKDLQEAINKRRVCVYILLDQACVPQFLKMCKTLGVVLEEQRYMRVRTITGGVYCTRSGTKIVGQVHEKFMLVDGLRTATGSYSYTWSDGKLNSSTLTVLSGQVCEHFDMEFRVLYAQSKPINPKAYLSYRGGATCEQEVKKTTETGQNLLKPEASLSASTPCNTPCKPPSVTELPPDVETKALDACISETSTIGDDAPQIAALLESDFLDSKVTKNMCTQTDMQDFKPNPQTDSSTQTTTQLIPKSTQTAVVVKDSTTQTITVSRAIMTQTDCVGGLLVPPAAAVSSLPNIFIPKPLSKDSGICSTKSSLSSTKSDLVKNSTIFTTTATTTTNRYCKYQTIQKPDYSLRDCFKKLTKERQYHYSVVRSKLDHMVALLSKRRYQNDAICWRNAPSRSSLRRRNEITTDLMGFRDVAHITTFHVKK